jgi:hypothetical protein
MGTTGTGGQCIKFFFRFFFPNYFCDILPTTGTTGTSGRACPPRGPRGPVGIVLTFFSDFFFRFFFQDFFSSFFWRDSSHHGDHRDQWESLPTTGTMGTGGHSINFFFPIFLFRFFFKFCPPRGPWGPVGEPAHHRDHGDR